MPASDLTVQHASTCLTNSMRDICNEGKAVECEEQLKLSEIRLKPIVINDLDLKVKVSNFLRAELQPHNRYQCPLFSHILNQR